MTTTIDTETILARMPPLELSYETVTSYRKVSTQDTPLGLAIPRSKKYVLYVTFYETQDVAVLMELNRQKKIVHSRVFPCVAGSKFAWGTLVYGSLMDDGVQVPVLCIEDLLMYQGTSVRNLPFGERLGMIQCLVRSSPIEGRGHCVGLGLALPIMFAHNGGEDLTTLRDTLRSRSAYPIHHLQFRSLRKILPYLNVNEDETLPDSEHDRRFFPEPLQKRKGELRSEKVSYNCPTQIPGKILSTAAPTPKYLDPQPRERSIFEVTADVQSDIYHLQHPAQRYRTDVAYIPDYVTSVWMNRLFRRIEENARLDALEESDDEEEFQDTRFDKYVNLTRRVFMECMYHAKFRRWVPVRVIDEEGPTVPQKSYRMIRPTQSNHGPPRAGNGDARGNPVKAARMRERYASLGLELQVYEGVPHTDPRIAGRGLSRDLERLWSVTYGHLDMIQRFYDGGTAQCKPYALFGEDDVVLNRTLPLNLPYLMAEASHLELDVVLLGYMKTFKVEAWMAGYAALPLRSSAYPGCDPVATGRPYTYHEYPADQWGVHLYMVSRAGARRILDTFQAPPTDGTSSYADRYVNDPARPFSPDWTITKCPGIRRALVSPMFAVEDGSDDYEHYAHGGQYQFHRDTYTFHYVPGLFV